MNNNPCEVEPMTCKDLLRLSDSCVLLYAVAMSRVRPMYTSDTENRQHWSLLEHRRIGIGKSPMSML